MFPYLTFSDLTVLHHLVDNPRPLKGAAFQFGDRDEIASIKILKIVRRVCDVVGPIHNLGFKGSLRGILQPIATPIKNSSFFFEDAELLFLSPVRIPRGWIFEQRV